MAWTLLFLAFLSYCSGDNSQLTVSQPGSQSVPLGKTVMLSCSKSGGSKWGSTYWYQQKPGQAPRFVWYGSKTRGEGIPDRFSGSSFEDTGYLTISNTKTADEANYICAAWGNNYGNDVMVFGKGTKLFITVYGS